MNRKTAPKLMTQWVLPLLDCTVYAELSGLKFIGLSETLAIFIKLSFTLNIPQLNWNHADTFGQHPCSCSNKRGTLLQIQHTLLLNYILLAITIKYEVHT